MAVRILLDIHHPKHVHFFRPLIRRWQARGDTVQIVTRDKDITHRLLELFGLPYVCLSRQQRGWRTGVELAQRWARFGRWIRRFRPDVVLSVAGITSAPPSRLLGVANIAFTDTETAVLSNRIALPFADPILTPESFSVRVDRIHHVLAFASLVVGESPSMAAEAALLGVPAVLISSWAGRCGNMQILEKQYGLMQVFGRSRPGVAAALALAEHPPDREAVQARRQALLADLCDMPAMVDSHIAAVRNRVVRSG